MPKQVFWTSWRPIGKRVVRPGETKKTWFVTSLLAMICLGFIGCGVKVVVHNNTGAALTDVELRFKGGAVAQSSLASGKAFSATINPQGESDILFGYLNADGVRCSTNIGVYIEHNYAGRIIISVGTNSQVTWEDKTRIR